MKRYFNAYLVDRNGSNWESMLERIKAAGWKNDERTLKAYDCPMSSSYSRMGKAGFGSAEEVMEHLKTHGQDNLKEGGFTCYGSEDGVRICMWIQLKQSLKSVCVL